MASNVGLMRLKKELKMLCYNVTMPVCRHLSESVLSLSLLGGGLSVRTMVLGAFPSVPRAARAAHVTVSFCGCTKRSRVRKNTVQPIFNQELQLVAPNVTQPVCALCGQAAAPAGCPCAARGKSRVGSITGR